MKKFSKFILSLIVVTGLLLPISASAYTIEQDPITFSYHPGYSSNQIIVLHESGNANNVGSDSLDREVSFMKRNWQNAYVSYFVGSGGRVKQLAPNGYYQYGAGALGNARAYAQIELARTNNAATFKKDYAAYVNLTRDLAKQAGFTLDLDDGTPYGIKTHLWITQNWWGDHTDPYSYLASWGISKAQLQKDLYSGLPESEGTSNQSKPEVKPSTPSGQKVNQGIYRVDDIQYVNGLWQVRSNFLVPTEFNWTENGISVDDIVLVDSNGYILKDQTTKAGSLFVFNTNYIKSVSGAQNGTGGYKWCQVNLSHSGNIWLSVADKNDLIHKISNA